jgi:anti-anti-sigma factor
MWASLIRRGADDAMQGVAVRVAGHGVGSVVGPDEQVTGRWSGVRVDFRLAAFPCVPAVEVRLMPRVEHRQAVTVFLRGEFDLARGHEITDRIDRALAASGAQDVAVDLADVTFLDCYSLGQLIGGYRRAAAQGTVLFVVHPDDELVRLVLASTGVDDLLQGPQGPVSPTASGSA